MVYSGINRLRRTWRHRGAERTWKQSQSLGWDHILGFGQSQHISHLQTACCRLSSQTLVLCSNTNSNLSAVKNRKLQITGSSWIPNRIGRLDPVEVSENRTVCDRTGVWRRQQWNLKRKSSTWVATAAEQKKVFSSFDGYASLSARSTIDRILFWMEIRSEEAKNSS